MDEKKQKARVNLERAIGWLEGIAYSVDSELGDGMMDTLAVIDGSLKILLDEE